jgi:AcrR family transcriptional regulator
MSTLLTPLTQGSPNVNSVDMKKKSSHYHHGELKATIERIAWDTVAAEGAANLSLRACARAADVDPAAVYRHFKSKDDILIALTGRAFAELSAAMLANKEHVDGASAGEAVLSVGLTYIDYATRNPNIFSMMFAVAGKIPADKMDLDGSDIPNAYQILQDALTAWLPNLDEEDLEALSFALWSNVHGVSELFNKGLGPDTDEGRKTRARAVCKMALDGGKSVLLAHSRA